MPVVVETGWVRVHCAIPLLVVLVDDPPLAPPSRLPVAPACDSVIVRPLSVVTVWPLVSWTLTVIVELWVEPATMLVGLAAQPSFAGAPTGVGDGTVMRQKMP